MVEFAFADEVQRSCQFCATIARAKIEYWWKRQSVPEPSDLTATVTFMSFEGRTFAVTAGHVIDIFREAAELDGSDPEGYFLPVTPGIAVHPPFVRPPKPWTAPKPDVALRPIHPDLPRYIGKRAFELIREPQPVFPVPYALAVGFPTESKAVLSDPRGERLALSCVHAIAQSVGTNPQSDQFQFWSEIESRPSTASLSGLSGGPVFWSDGTSFGLLGFVKEALDLFPKGNPQAIYSEPRVHFVCQRATHDDFSKWVTYADEAFPKLEAELTERLARKARKWAGRNRDRLP